MRRKDSSWDAGHHAAPPRLMQRARIVKALRACFSTRRTSSRSKPSGLAGIARQRDPYRRVRHQVFHAPGAVPQPLLSAFLAGIRLQETAGGRREANFRARPCLPQWRADKIAHPEFTMLEWYRAGDALSRLDRRLRRRAAGRGAGGAGSTRFHIRRREPRSFRRAGNSDRHGSLQRYAGIDLLGDARRPRRPGRRRRSAWACGWTPDDHWSDLFSKISVGQDRAAARPRAGDGADRLSGQRGGAGAAQTRGRRVSPKGSSFMAAASNWPTPSAN